MNSPFCGSFAGSVVVSVGLLSALLTAGCATQRPRDEGATPVGAASAAPDTAGCPALPAASAFAVKPVSRDSRVEMSLETPDAVVGRIAELTGPRDRDRAYELRGHDGALIARARTRIVDATSNTILEVRDCRDRVVGRIEEQFFPDAFRPYARYELRDAADHVVAGTSKEYYLRKELVLRAPGDRTVAEYSRPMLSLGQPRWDVKLSAPAATTGVDSRLTWFLPYFKGLLDENHADAETQRSGGGA